MDWQPYLRNLSRHLLSNLDDEELQELRERHNVVDYLGRPPATCEWIQQTEARLGFKLPDSLTNFYQISDGWHSADGFPIGIANLLPVAELFLLSDCRMRELDIYRRYVTEQFDVPPFSKTVDVLENCVVLIDLDGNELGFVVRSLKLDDWPIVTYDPDGHGFRSYVGFADLMKDGMNY